MHAQMFIVLQTFVCSQYNASKEQLVAVVSVKCNLLYNITQFITLTVLQLTQLPDFRVDNVEAGVLCSVLPALLLK